MYIKNIVKNCAVLLNKDNVVNYVVKNTNSGDAKETAEKLINLTNVVINELSTVGFYLVRTQTIKRSDEKIAYSSLRSKPIKILSLTDENGKEYQFKALTEHVIVDKKATVITYSYEVDEKSLDAVVTFQDYRLTEMVIAMGVAAEYLLTMHDFDGAVYWHERFVEMLKKYKSTKNVNVKGRSFI